MGSIQVKDTPEDLDALRVKTIAGNKRTMARITELQAQLEQLRLEQPAPEELATNDRIEELGALIIERLDRLIELNRDAIARATGES